MIKVVRALAERTAEPRSHAAARVWRDVAPRGLGGVWRVDVEVVRARHWARRCGSGLVPRHAQGIEV